MLNKVFLHSILTTLHSAHDLIIFVLNFKLCFQQLIVQLFYLLLRLSDFVFYFRMSIIDRLRVDLVIGLSELANLAITETFTMLYRTLEKVQML